MWTANIKARKFMKILYSIIATNRLNKSKPSIFKIKLYKKKKKRSFQYSYNIETEYKYLSSPGFCSCPKSAWREIIYLAIIRQFRYFGNLSKINCGIIIFFFFFVRSLVSWLNFMFLWDLSAKIKSDNMIKFIVSIILFLLHFFFFFGSCFIMS